MNNKGTLGILLMTLLLAFPSALLAAGDGERTFSVSSGSTVSVHTTMGQIRLVSWDTPGSVKVVYQIDTHFMPGGTKVFVQSKGRPSSSGGDREALVSPAFEQKGGTLVIREEFRRRAYRGVFAGAVHFTVYVPRNVELEAHSVVGNIVAEKTVGGKFHSVSGDVELKGILSGPTEAQSVCGFIRCQVAAPFSDNLNLHNTNGNISLELARGGDFRLEASTYTGTIQCALKLKGYSNRRSFGASTVTGSLGSGTGKVVLETMSGQLDVR